MEFIKMINLIIILITLTHCNGQGKIIYPKEKIMNTEKLDINKYNKLKKERDERGDMTPCEDTLSNGTIITYYVSDSASEDSDIKELIYNVKITPAPPELYCIYKEYYSTGIIKEESKQFIGEYDIPIGDEKIYDKSGQLIKIINYSDYDKNINIKFNDLLNILQKEPLFTYISKKTSENLIFGLYGNNPPDKITIEGLFKEFFVEGFNGKILNPYNDNDRKSISINLEKNIWYVKKDMYPQGIFYYVFDANTGKLMDYSYDYDKRP